jgi:methylphosphotriester-DNA--protein-cysteine methyltransferase
VLAPLPPLLVVRTRGPPSMRAVGGRRSVLAERFARLVGAVPMHYLARWRMQLVARLLADGGIKLRAVTDAGALTAVKKGRPGRR